MTFRLIKTRFPAILLASALLVAVVLGGNSTKAQTFTNGGFEIVTGSPIPTNTAVTLNPGDTWLTGWRATGPDGGVAVQNGLDGYTIGNQVYGLTPYAGQQWLVFPNDNLGGSVSQTFSTTVGSYCTVSFATAYVYTADDPLLGVSVTDLHNTVLTNNVYVPEMRVWTNFQMSFLATTSTTTLTFTDASGDAEGADLGIDGVSMVPEPLGWPYIVTQPLSQTNGAGTKAVFTAQAGGNPSTVQWFLGTNLVPAATNTTLTVMADQTNAGSYTAVFSNRLGTNATLPALLTVLQVITSPASQTVNAGSIVTFAAVANLPKATVQWYFGPYPVNGETFSNFGVVANNQTAGIYSAQFTYGGVMVTSAPALLVVTNIPFQNGSFENRPVGASSDAEGDPSNQFLTGWDFGGVVNEIFVFNGGFQGLNPEDGNQWVLFDSQNSPPGGIVSQTFSTTIGDTYRVTFWTAEIYDGGNPAKSLRAAALASDGSVLASNNVVPAGTWTSNQITFVSRTLDTTVVFTDTSPPNLGPSVALDNVAVTDLNYIPPPNTNTLSVASFNPGQGAMVLQLAGTNGQTFVIATSTNLRTWMPVSTNTTSGGIVNITNALMAGSSHQFWKAVPGP